MDSRQITIKLKLLNIYLHHLPTKLPLAQAEDCINRFLKTSLDSEWVDDIGEEGAANRAIEAGLQGLLPRSDEGIFPIKQRGKGIVAFGKFLEFWLGKHPSSLILQKWLEDASNSVVQCYTDHIETVRVSCF